MQDQDSDTAKKEAEIDKLRAAEKFMKVGSKNAVCNSCQYEYEAKKGDPEYPVGPNTAFTVRTCCGSMQCSALRVYMLLIQLQPLSMCRSCHKTGNVQCAEPRRILSDHKARPLLALLPTSSTAWVETGLQRGRRVWQYMARSWHFLASLSQATSSSNISCLHLACTLTFLVKVSISGAAGVFGHVSRSAARLLLPLGTILTRMFDWGPQSAFTVADQCMHGRAHMGNAALPVTAASLVYAVEVSSSKNELQGRLAPSAVTHPTLHPYDTKQQAHTFGSCMSSSMKTVGHRPAINMVVQTHPFETTSS